ncbi:MAG TPA: dihydropteroate synthase [Terriglobales bacterium]|nr:dihydropteroate synthase [Terriglobales bacterium]
MRPHFTWRLKTRSLVLGPRTLVMGVVNVTPDSFSDGGLYLAPDRALTHALRLLDEGADIVDIGGESTRPGSAQRVPEEEELRRVLPVVEGVLRERPQAVISVDTYKSGTARRVVEAGAEIINDISAFRWDPAMAQTVAGLACGCVLMHMRGRPEEWRTLAPIDNLPGRVLRDLAHWAQQALDSGVARDRIVLDPGFGFGKNFEENYPLLARFRELRRLDFPLLAGASRKSFLGRTLARNGHDAPPAGRPSASLAAMTAAILQGAHIVRVHDVRESVEAARIADAILAAKS